MIKRIFVLSFLLLICIFCGGCKDEKKPMLLFNSQQITQKTVYNPQEVFKPGQTINYVILMPKGFKKDYLRMQVINCPENVNMGGVSISYSSDVFVDMSKKFYIDKFVLHNEGHYVVRFFYSANMNKAIIERNLWVKN